VFLLVCLGCGVGPIRIHWSFAMHPMQRFPMERILGVRAGGLKAQVTKYAIAATKPTCAG
jgi:hypothetical protein